MYTNRQDSARLRLLLQHADQQLEDAVKEINEAQVDSAKDRTQYFEKLTIGSGAVIAAIVSFLGAHSAKLQPAWMLRCSLVSLVIALTTSLYRNLRYPSYFIAVRNRIWIEACRQQQQSKNDVFQSEKNLIAIQTGEPIDMQEWTREFKKSDAGLEKLIGERVRRENRLLIEVRVAEYVCLSSVGLAMISLVWLALRNF
jgi:hypothetical protein